MSISVVLGYNINRLVFPSLFVATAYGAENIGSKVVSILAPMIAEIPQPVPQLLYFCVTVFSAIIVLFLKIPRETDLHRPLLKNN